MKKIISIGILILSVLTLSACKEEEKTVEMSSTYDVGEFTVGLPEGWIESPFYINGTEETMNDSITLYKSDNDLDHAIFNAPGITISYNQTCTSTEEYYEDSVKVDKAEIDGITYEGFNSENNGFPFTQYIGNTEDACFQLMLLQERTDGTINITDEEVIAILESIEIN